MLQEQPFELPVPGDQEHAVADRRGRPVEPDPPAVDLRRARARRVRPRQGEHQLVLPLPREAADAEDLSLAQIERHVLQRPAIAQVPHRKQRLAAAAGRVPRACVCVRGLARDMAHDPLGVLAVLLEIDLRDVLPVSEDRHLVADLHDLPETVGGEHDRHLLPHQAAEEREQALHLRLFQRRRRLVEDEELRTGRDRLGDLHDLHLPGAELGEHPVQVETRA